MEFNAKRADTFLDRVNDAESTEFLAIRLLLAHQQSRPSLEEKIRDALLKHQNSDGGWGWKVADPSDALGTGYALYALIIAGVRGDQTDRAVEYLLSTQETDGSWSVPGTKRSADGDVTETATDWGSAWAMIALAAESKRAK